MRAVAKARAQVQQSRLAEQAGGDAVRRATEADPRLGWIERMRVYRGFRDRDLTVGGAIDGMAREFRARHDALGDVIDAWNELAPRALRGLVRIEGLWSGTLTLATASSGAGYELTRELRNGLERTLVSRLPGRVRRVRVKVGTGDAVE